MTNSRLLACFTALALLVACSEQRDSTQEAQSDEGAKVATETASIAANDGGIPLSSSDEATLSQYMTARSLADRGDFIEANQAARKLTEEHPDFVGGWIMLGNTALSGRAV